MQNRGERGFAFIRLVAFCKCLRYKRSGVIIIYGHGEDKFT
jgi:hypothetical protein